MPLNYASDEIHYYYCFITYSTAAMSKCLGMLPRLLLEANTDHEALTSSMVTLMTAAASQGCQSLLRALAQHMTGLLGKIRSQTLKLFILQSYSY